MCRLKGVIDGKGFMLMFFDFDEEIRFLYSKCQMLTCCYNCVFRVGLQCQILMVELKPLGVFLWFRSSRFKLFHLERPFLQRVWVKRAVPIILPIGLQCRLGERDVDFSDEVSDCRDGFRNRGLVLILENDP